MAKAKLSRQQKWQAARRAQGLCIRCGAEPLINKNHGKRCAEKQREHMRKVTGAKIRYKSAGSYAKLATSDQKRVRH